MSNDTCANPEFRMHAGCGACGLKNCDAREYGNPTVQEDVQEDDPGFWGRACARLCMKNREQKKEIDHLTELNEIRNRLLNDALALIERWRKLFHEEEAGNAKLENALAIATGYVKNQSTRTHSGKLFDIKKALE